uniref:Uncharacterized protein n=1 Tax=Trichogramma kaykai TaxID=54128 RepID=A0ABD2WIB9_9HYME
MEIKYSIEAFASYELNGRLAAHDPRSRCMSVHAQSREKVIPNKNSCLLSRIFFKLSARQPLQLFLYTQNAKK